MLQFFFLVNYNYYMFYSIEGNSVDFQEIWKLLINPNSILSSKSSKSQTEENNQEKVEEENEAEEAGEIQTNLVHKSPLS